MAVEVAKVELKSVQDASGLEERILAGQFTADQVVAVVGKTEGNGGVNDFTRLLADHAFRRVLQKHGKLWFLNESYSISRQRFGT